MTSFLVDLDDQPPALQRFLDTGLTAEATRLLRGVRRFDRVVMTGMGASLFAQYPAYLKLAAAGVPVWLVETAELLGIARGLVTARSLVWVTSQSGASAETVALLDAVAVTRPRVLAVTNDSRSTLAAEADEVIELRAGAESGVSTRTYVNSLAALALAARAATGAPADESLSSAPEALAAYLAEANEHVEGLDRAVSGDATFILGRGASLAAAQTGALVAKEAARAPVEAMSAPQFRHGPLEAVDSGVTTIVLEGSAADAPRNEHTLHHVRRSGGIGVWIGRRVAGGHPLPELGGDALPIAEIVPLQLLSVALARRKGIEAGVFRHVTKVTRTL